MSGKVLIAQRDEMECWWLPNPLSCCYFDRQFCDATTHYIVKKTDTDFVVPLCYRHLPQWARQGIGTKDRKEKEVGA